jgi:hypothetical protein
MTSLARRGQRPAGKAFMESTGNVRRGIKCRTAAKTGLIRVSKKLYFGRFAGLNSKDKSNTKFL